MVFYSSRLPDEANENGFRPYYDQSPDFSTMRFATFVETVFIPEHVARKTFAGQTHYCAILKHVLHPETVDRLLGQHHSGGKAKLRALRGWPYMDDVPLRDVTPAHVIRIVLAAFAQGYSAQTVKHIRSVIGAIISHAISENFLHGNNPVSSVPLPPIVHKRTQRLDAAQVRSILRLMKYPEREMTLITIATGMSISEICGMQWKHVNLTRAEVERDLYSIPPRSILVRQQWNARGLVEIRAGRSRCVQIPDALADVLSILKSQQTNSDPDVFVLTSELGSPISSATARDTVLKPIGRRLNMPWLSWQVIKRTQVSLMMELRTQLSHDLVLNLG
jgi:integrase